MSHDLMQRNGKTAMFCVGDRDSAWHKLGQRTPNAVTWQEAVKLADLDWQVVKIQNYARNPLKQVVPLPVWSTFRNDDGEFLGTVGEDYHIIQNRDQFTWMDSILASSDGAHYESAGALGRGERVWCQARIPVADYQIDGGDKHQIYLLGVNSHDRSMSHVLKMVDCRVVCNNTLNMALGENTSEFRVRHTKGAADKMSRALSLLQQVTGTAMTLKMKMEHLAETKLTRESCSRIFDRLFPAPKDEKANHTRHDNILRDVLELYEINDRNAFPSIKGTAYNLLNAVTEYTDHLRTARGNGSKPEEVSTARAESAMFGSGDALKRQALDVIYQETVGASGGGLLDRVISQN